MKSLSQMRDGKPNVEAAMELVMTCSGYTLGRFANAVGLRYQQLVDKGKVKK